MFKVGKDDREKNKSRISISNQRKILTTWYKKEKEKTGDEKLEHIFHSKNKDDIVTKKDRKSHFSLENKIENKLNWGYLDAGLTL